MYIENATTVEMNNFSVQRNLGQCNDFKVKSSTLKTLDQVYQDDQPLIDNQVIEI